MATSVTRKPVMGPLAHHFEAHPGTRVYIEELTKDLNLPADRVRSGISNLRQTEPWKSGLHIVTRGHCWMFRPGAQHKAETSKRVFEELAVTKSGDVLIQDEEGKIYRATEL